MQKMHSYVSFIVKAHIYDSALKKKEAKQALYNGVPPSPEIFLCQTFFCQRSFLFAICIDFLVTWDDTEIGPWE